MPIYVSIILLVVGMVFLIKGADFFVEGASSIAKALKIPSIFSRILLIWTSTVLVVSPAYSNPNKVFTRDQLLDKVWGFDYLGDSRTVDVHVKRLREKLEGVSDKWMLKTVWGVGYKFELL